MKYNLELLHKHYIDTGKVIKQNHPTLPLSIYNYSRTTQYDGNWDRYTLACRGLVLDNEGNVIAKPFPKFFNYEEIKDDKYAHCEGCRKSGMINCAHPEECGGWEMRSVIPNEPFEVFEKMDGSLGIIFHYEGEWHMATRGSFTSEQAIKGKELLDKLSKTALIPGYTYLVEIIYPENRIVVDYGDEEKLVVLGAYNNETGKEVEVDEMVNEGWDIVNRYDGVNDYTKLKKMISNDSEGYVIRFSGGMRMKIKGDEYVRLHRILTNFSTKDIWELLKNGEPLEPFLERVPDEFDKWVKAVVMNLRYSFYSIDERAGKLHDGFRYGKYNDKEVEPTKKEFAEYTKQFPKELSAVMFKMWDKKPYDHLIWSMIKPKYEKPFKNEDN
jgi:RNA ligase